MFQDSIYNLGNKPIYVLSSGRDAFSNDPDSLMKSVRLEKLMQKEKMARLSSNSKHIITTRSGHEIHLDEPELVIRAIKDVSRAARRGEKL